MARPVRGSRTMVPPIGSGVSSVIPSSASAARLTHAECRSFASRYTGRSGTTASSISAVGVPSGTAEKSQLMPVTRGLSGLAPAHCTTRRWISPRSPAVRSCAFNRLAPVITTWAWASTNPGRAMPPRRSVSSASAPANAVAASLLPTNAMCSPSITTASAHNDAESAVKMRPPVISRTSRPRPGRRRGRGRS